MTGPKINCANNPKYKVHDTKQRWHLSETWTCKSSEPISHLARSYGLSLSISRDMIPKTKYKNMAWARKITYEWKVVAFSHDFPAEVNNKLRDYKDMKKILKEKQVRYQTPYPAKIRIYRENRPCIKVQRKYQTMWEVKATPYTSPYKPWLVTGNRGSAEAHTGAKKDRDHCGQDRERIRDSNRKQVWILYYQAPQGIVTSFHTVKIVEENTLETFG